jgi:DNA-binding cell septation regulator SpoVG
MNITKVQIHLNHGTTPKVKAWADIIIDDEFIIKGLAIREDVKDHYCFVTMPYKILKNTVEPGGDVQREDVAHPIREACRKYIEDTVLDWYEEVLNDIANNKETKS